MRYISIGFHVFLTFLLLQFIAMGFGRKPSPFVHRYAGLPPKNRFVSKSSRVPSIKCHRASAVC